MPSTFLEILHRNSIMDDGEILQVRAKPRPKSASLAGKSKSKSGGPYLNKSTSAKSGGKRSASELWLASIKSGSGALSSGRKPGQHPGKRTPSEYWMDTLRKTGEGLSTESTKMHTLTGVGRPIDPMMPFLSTSHYLRQTAGLEKTPRKFDDPTSRPPPGTPAYKSQEEYYEEILALRKQIAGMTNENSLVKSRLRRTEEDNSKKEKEIEKLLDPSKSNEMRRSLADRKPDTGSVIHGLKQKIVRLEQQFKEKEADHKKLLSDVKVTNINEMKIQMEAFYTEIVRLQRTKAANSKSSAPANVAEPKESSAKIKALNETILRLNDSNTRLQIENRSLKQDLAKHLHDTAVDEVDSSNKEYADMSKRQLIAEISKLQKKVDKFDSDSLSLISEFENKRKDGKVEGKVVLTGSVNERLNQLDKRETELLQEREKHLEVIQKSREERATYRKKCESLEKEVKDLLKELDHLKAGSDVLGLRESRPASTRPDSAPRSRSSVPDASLRHDLVDEKERQRRIEEFQQKHAAKVMQRSWKKKQLYQEQNRRAPDDDEASLLQATIRGHNNRKDRATNLRREADHDRSSTKGRGLDVDDDAGLDDDIVTIQSAFRGHMGRKDGASKTRLYLARLANEEREAELTTMEESIRLIQSVVRGHITRKVIRHRLRSSGSSVTGGMRPSSGKNIRTRATPNDNELDSAGESLDDDSIVVRAAPARPESRDSRDSSTIRSPSRTPSPGKRPSSASSRDVGTSSGVYASPRRRSPSMRQVQEDDDDDDDIVF